MASRVSLIQSRSIYVGTANNVAPSDGNLIVTGNVGIGTTAPGTLLHLVQSSGPTIRLVRTSNRFDVTADNDFMELNARDASTYMIFKTADTERMRITSAGNVGIGTTAPAAILHVSSTGANAYSSTITKGSNLKGIINTLSNNADDMVGIYFGTGTTSEGTHWSGITG